MRIRQREYYWTFVMHRIKAYYAVVNQVIFLTQFVLCLKITKVKHNTHVFSTFIYQTRQILCLLIELVFNPFKCKICCILRKLFSKLIVIHYFLFKISFESIYIKWKHGKEEGIISWLTKFLDKLPHTRFYNSILSCLGVWNYKREKHLWDCWNLDEGQLFVKLQETQGVFLCKESFVNWSKKSNLIHSWC